MKAKPLTHSPAMIRAKLAGRKRQTRRIIKPVLGPQAHWTPWEAGGTYKANGLLGDIPIEARAMILYCPYEPGQILRAREAFRIDVGWFIEDSQRFKVRGVYLADKSGFETLLTEEESEKYSLWKHPNSAKSPMYMFASLSRLYDRVVSVRVERVQDITEADAKAEGIVECWPGAWHWEPSAAVSAGATPAEAYRTLWESINGPVSWETNPWVWVLKTEPVEKPSR